MIHPNQQLSIAKSYFDTLSNSDLSKRYSQLTKAPEFGTWSRIKMLFNIEGYYKQLTKFYPYHNVITASAKAYDEEVKCAVQTGLTISAVTVFAIYQFARRGQVMPVLRKYGKYLGTHRVFRQYIWAWLLPTTLLWTQVDFKHIDNVEQLWSVHARRMQKHIFEDPEGSQYPEHLLKANFNDKWTSLKYIIDDAAAKVSNEGLLSQSSSYENPQFEAVDFGEQAVEGADE